MKTTFGTKLLLGLYALMLSGCGAGQNSNLSIATTSTVATTTTSIPPITTTIPESTTTPPPPTTEIIQSPAIAGPVILLGDGLGAARFGQAETAAIAQLEKVLGTPVSTTPAPANGNCTIDSYLQWPSMTVYFDHQEFVGYATTVSHRIGNTVKILNATTLVGLRIGDTLAQARQIYGAALRTSFAQGGSWFATTPQGILAGYLTAEVDQQTPPPRIAGITAGSVGCSAVSP